MSKDVVYSDNLQRLDIIRKLNAKSEWVNYDLYRLLFKPELYILAYEHIKSRPGQMASGTDEETIDGFRMETITTLIEDIRAETYQPKPIRKVYATRSGKMRRRSGVPSVRDKIVQEVVKLILEAIYDSPYGAYFKDCSFGFRRSRSCHSALREIQGKWSGTIWFLKGEIKTCFDDINHEILVTIIRKKVKDERFLNLIWKFLKAGYQDVNESRKDSLAGIRQGSIVSSVLTNIYLHELDEYVEQLQKDLVKGELRRPNPEYRSLQKRRQYLGKTGRINTREYKKLGVQMRKLPSLDPKDPNFVRVRYVRYADSWIVGITSPKSLAEEIKGRIRQFLKAKLDLTLSEEQAVITNARTSEAKFLGYRIRLGRSKTAEQKQTLSTNASGKNFKRRSTGMQIVLRAPINELIKKLCQKGFCNAQGRPLYKKAWILLDEDQIVSLYSSINRGLQNYYRPTDNWVELSRIQYILKFSLAKTLASKRQSKMTKIIKNKDIAVQVTRNEQQRTITFYRNTDWTIDRKAFSESSTVDLVRMNERMRTRSKLGLPCCICLERIGIVMHHIKHIRKITDQQAKGFNGLLVKLNRKQIPVCQDCHRKIHSGAYDKMKLSGLAYAPRKPIV